MFQSTRPRGARHRRRREAHHRELVSIHAPTRGATGLPCQAAHGQDVSIQAPTRGATTRACCCCRSRIGFNPRAHEGRDVDGQMGHDTVKGFNPRAHEGRDLMTWNWTLVSELFQSTRPRGARRSTAELANCAIEFQSTRPRGARPGGTCRERGSEKFQSTRPRGARRAHVYVMPSGDVFQSTRPRGARPRAVRRAEVVVRVSIHAPTRGATRSARARRSGRCCFNPRAHEGRDYHHRVNWGRVVPFQSTRPRGARPYAGPPWAIESPFQSTRPRGARPIARVRKHVHIVVSIHAPTRGATGLSRQAAHGQDVSIHAPTRGATGHTVYSERMGRFQSTRPRGARPRVLGAGLRHQRVSIHAPTRGATRTRLACRSVRACFNPRAHEGRDRPPTASRPRSPGFNPRAHEGRDGQSKQRYA